MQVQGGGHPFDAAFTDGQHVSHDFPDLVLRRSEGHPLESSGQAVKEKTSIFFFQYRRPLATASEII
jgi:hypothetical protein